MHSESWWVKPEGLSLECRVGYLELRRLKLKYTWQLTPCFSVKLSLCICSHTDSSCPGCWLMRYLDIDLLVRDRYCIVQ